MKILSSFLILKFFQTCMSLFVLLNIKEYILKYVDNQIVAGSRWWKKKYYGSQRDQQLFGYQHS